MIQYDVKKFIENSLVTPLLIKSPLLYVPLFHGTDQSILNMTKDERAYAKHACLTIIPRLLSTYIEYGFFNNLSTFRKASDVNFFQKVSKAYIIANGLANNSTLYEYEHTYLTNNLDRAHNYALNASIFGELGFTADQLYKGIKKFEFKLPELSTSEQIALDFIKKSSLKKAQPVVLMFFGLEKSLLAYETGISNVLDLNDIIISFMQNEFSSSSLRYLGQLDLSTGIPIDITQITIKK